MDKSVPHGTGETTSFHLSEEMKLDSKVKESLPPTPPSSDEGNFSPSSGDGSSSHSTLQVLPCSSHEAPSSDALESHAETPGENHQSKAIPASSTHDQSAKSNSTVSVSLHSVTSDDKKNRLDDFTDEANNGEFDATLTEDNPESADAQQEAASSRVTSLTHANARSPNVGSYSPYISESEAFNETKEPTDTLEPTLPEHPPSSSATLQNNVRDVTDPAFEELSTQKLCNEQSSALVTSSIEPKAATISQVEATSNVVSEAAEIFDLVDRAGPFYLDHPQQEMTSSQSSSVTNPDMSNCKFHFEPPLYADTAICDNRLDRFRAESDVTSELETDDSESVVLLSDTSVTVDLDSDCDVTTQHLKPSYNVSPVQLPLPLDVRPKPPITMTLRRLPAPQLSPPTLSPITVILDNDDHQSMHERDDVISISDDSDVISQTGSSQYKLRPRRPKSRCSCFGDECSRKSRGVVPRGCWKGAQTFMREQRRLEALRDRLCALYRQLLPDSAEVQALRPTSCAVDEMTSAMVDILRDRAPKVHVYLGGGDIDESCDLVAAIVECASPRKCVGRLRKRAMQLVHLLLPDLDLPAGFRRDSQHVDDLLDHLVKANAVS